MNGELKYPIKYAILELKERGGWVVGYEDITQGFIVSKCYVVESNIKYYSNGESKITYRVVFPFKNISDFRLSLQRGTSYNSEGIIPAYDAYGNPCPVDVVSNLFDSYEQAQEIAVQKNEELKIKFTSNVSFLDENWEETYEELMEEFLENLNVCQKFEEFILVQTDSMNISQDETQIIKKLKM